MKGKKLLALLMALCMATALVAACGSEEPAPAAPAAEQPAAEAPAADAPAAEEPAAPAGDGLLREPYVAPEVVTTLPREESLYFGGLGWSPIAGWSPLMGSTQNWANDQNGGGSRTMVFETPYMYNAMTGGYHPLLAIGDFVWNDNYTELTYKINPAACWSDGTKVTAHDAQATWDIKLNYTLSGGANWTPYIESVVAVDDETVKVTATKTPEGGPVFYKMIETFVIQDYILQKAWLESIVERTGGDPAAIDVEPGMDFVWSGPYTRYFEDDTRTVLIRDDGYWGQDASMWGKLPAPKYLVNTVLNDNTAIRAAFASGDLDVSQAFMPNSNTLWEDEGLPVSTFIDGPPYHLAANMPTIWFNLRHAGDPALKEVELRKAIAWATDYDAINANAMTGQSPTFAEVPRSLMNPTPGEQAMYNRTPEIQALQWVGNDIDGANALLDESGKFPKGSDGWRTYNGEKVSLTAHCPQGWSDWEASLEIVAAAGEKIGIEITTQFLQESEFYDHVVNDITSGEFDIFMMWTNSMSPTEPWGRIRNMLSSEFTEDNWTGSNWNGNWNGYSNPRVDELIAAIPLETDINAQKDMYTELVQIYLTDVPSFSAMYRPDKFHTVYEGVWTGYTEQGDGRDVPPFNCLSGYAIADLFNLRLVG